MKRSFNFKLKLNLNSILNVGNEKTKFKNHFKDLAISCAINSMTMNTSGPEIRVFAGAQRSSSVLPGCDASAATHTLT